MKILSDEKTTELSRYTPTADEWAIRPNHAYWAFRKLCEAQARLTREETLKEVGEWLLKQYHYRATLIGTPENPPFSKGSWFIKVADNKIQCLLNGQMPES